MLSIPASSDLLSLVEARRDALLGNTEKLEGLLHADFRYVDSLGRDLNRAEYLASRRSGELTLTRHDITDLVVRGLSPAAALITCCIHDEGRFRGQPFNGHARTVHICARHEDRWLFLYGHSTAFEP